MQEQQTAQEQSTQGHPLMQEFTLQRLPSQKSLVPLQQLDVEADHSGQQWQLQNQTSTQPEEAAQGQSPRGQQAEPPPAFAQEEGPLLEGQQVELQLAWLQLNLLTLQQWSQVARRRVSSSAKVVVLMMLRKCAPCVSKQYPALAQMVSLMHANASGASAWNS